MIEVLTNAQILTVAIPMIIGIIVGMVIGGQFTQKNYIGVTVNKEELRKALIQSDVADYLEDEKVAQQFMEQSINNVNDTLEVMEANGSKIYRVGTTMYIAADNPTKALGKALDSIKGRKGLFFKHGALDIESTYVEEVNMEEEVNG